nr:transcriptional regulator [Caldalkalibacillus mannanilyticus]
MTQGECDFTQLKKLLELSDGNLSAHLRILEESGYISVQKSFMGRRPKTTLSSTPKGREAILPI